MLQSERARAIAFMRRRNRALVDRVEPFRLGEALLTESLPKVHDLNFLLVDAPGTGIDAAELAEEASRIMGAAGLGHRRVNVDDEAAATRLVPGFDGLGWQPQRFLVMAHRHAPDRPVNHGSVPEVSLVDLRELHIQITREAPYGKDEELVRQIAAADERGEALGDARGFAILVDGSPASACELYSDGSTAQIENVATLTAHRGRGNARAVVQAALEAARGHELVFLVADRDDWPKELYRRLGFEAVGLEERFLKTL